MRRQMHRARVAQSNAIQNQNVNMMTVIRFNGVAHTNPIRIHGSILL